MSGTFTNPQGRTLHNLGPHTRACPSCDYQSPHMAVARRALWRCDPRELRSLGARLPQVRRCLRSDETTSGHARRRPRARCLAYLATKEHTT